MNIDDTTAKMSADDKIIEQFEKDWESMTAYWGELHKRHRADTKFTWFNKQWSDAAVNERAAKQGTSSSAPLPPRPMNVYNISKPFIIKVINGVKKMRPQLKVNPVDDGSDPELADVERGLLKAIEKNTGAVPSRMHALKDTVGSGFGFYGFDSVLENPKSFKHEVKYFIIEDATTVLWDEGSKEPDGSDMKKFISQSKMSKDNFKAEFGKKWEDIQDTAGGDLSMAWGSDEGPVISDYWYIEEKPEVLVQIDGVGHYLKDIEKELEESGQALEDIIDYDEEKGEYIQRKTTSRQVWRCRLAGKKILKKDKWPGYWIPRFKIDGRKTVSDGKVRIDGLTMDVRASQTSYNYARNNKLERMSLTQKSGIFHPVGGIPAGEKHKYDTANTRNWSRYGFNAYDKAGNPLPSPYRVQPTNLDPGAIQEEVTSAEEIKASLGMFGGYMGDTAGEKSGKAILAGAAESADITFDFAFNLGLTMNHEGKVLSELIPKIYDTAQQVRMVGEDDKDKVIWVNQQGQDENGKPYYYDLNKAKFDVSVTMGPSTEDKRSETRLEMESLYGKMPELREISADIFVQTHEWDKADELSERYRRFIQQKYPGIIKDKDEKEIPPEVQQMQQQMQEQQQQMKEMNQAMQQLRQENESMKVDKSLEAQKIENDDMNNEESNANVEYNNETSRFTAKANAKAKADELQFKREEAERQYKIKIAELEANKQSELQGQSDEQSRQQTEAHFGTMKSDLDNQLKAFKQELVQSAKDNKIELPPINITNEIKMPEKKNATITPKKGGGFDVKQEDAE